MSAKRQPGAGRKPLPIPRNKSLPRITTEAHAKLVNLARDADRTVAGQLEFMIKIAASLEWWVVRKGTPSLGGDPVAIFPDERSAQHHAEMFLIPVYVERFG